MLNWILGIELFDHLTVYKQMDGVWLNDTLVYFERCKSMQSND